MSKIKPYLPWTIRILVAVMFLFSAYAKIYPSANLALGTFEAKQLIPLGFSEGFAPYFSRFIIAVEFAIGLGLLQPHYLKRFIVPVAVALLAVFSFQLTYEMAVNGNSGNCGCFGALLPMTPLQALIKNIVAIGLLAYLWKVMKSDDKQRNLFAYPMLIFTSMACLIYATAPVQFTVNQPVNSFEGDSNVHSDFLDGDLIAKDTVVNDTLIPIELDTPEIDEPPKPYEPKAVVSKFSSFPTSIPSNLRIDEGKKILCMFAPGCEHCQATIKILTQMRSEIAGFPPIHIVFMDEEPEKIPEFFKIAGREYSYRIAPVAEFWKIIDFSKDTPGVCYLWNGNIRYFSDGINAQEFKKADLKKALAKKT